MFTMNNITTMTVFEHQRLTARDFAWTTDFDWLLSEELTVFTIKRKQGQWQLKVGYYIGIILLPSGSMLEILPKPIHIDDESASSTDHSLEQTRRWVHNMLAALSPSSISSKNFGHISTHVAPISDNLPPAKPPLSEWLIAQFVQYLSQYRPSSRYQPQTRNDTVMQGKLIIKEQLKRNRHQPHKFVCEISQLNQEIIANRIIKSALILLAPLLDQQVWALLPWQAITALNHQERRQLEAVYQQAKYQLTSQPLSLHQRRGAEQLLDLAYWLLKQSNIEAGHGLNVQPVSAPKMRLCVLLNMNQMFEQWASISIAATLKTIDSDYQPLYQAQSIWLSDDTGQTQLSMRPDLLILHHKSPLSTSTQTNYSHVIDIKWKSLTQAGAITSSDAYQLSSYAQAYQAEHVWLVHPVLNSRRPVALKPQGNIALSQPSASPRKLWLMPFNVLEGTLNLNT